MVKLEEATIWKIIEAYFADNPQALVRHHIDSYNDFFQTGLAKMFQEMNPLKIELDYDEERKINLSKCHLYFGGKNTDKIYYGKPTIHEKGTSRYLFPNECRLRNMTYGVTIHFDIDIEIERNLGQGEEQMLVDENGNVIFEDELDEADEEGKVNNDTKERIQKKMRTPNEVAKLKQNMEKAIVQYSENVKEKIVLEKMTLEQIYFGRFPIMVQSDLCILKGMSPDMRHKLGECKHDFGGYFIIDGKEKTIVCQEKFGDNMVRIDKSSDENLSYTAHLKSVSENASKYIRTMKVEIYDPKRMTVQKSKISARPIKSIAVHIPNVRKPVPLFILFRALGVITDKEIIEYCTLQHTEMLSPVLAEYFNACIHEAGCINTQYEAMKYLSLTIRQRETNTKQQYNEEHIANVLYILADYFLPHVGEMNFKDKALHIGYIVYRLLMTAIEIETPTDRDHYKFKRVEVVGSMMRDLFHEYYKVQQQEIRRFFETFYEYHKKEYDNPALMFRNTYTTVMKERYVEKGVMKGFKGNWGSTAHTTKVGVTQDLNRLSYNGFISHLRKTNIPIDNVKIVGPHMLHGSQWGFIDPMDTPDGGNVGIHKYMAIMTSITRRVSREPIKAYLESHSTVQKLCDCVPKIIGNETKIFLNGLWVGITKDQEILMKDLKLKKRHALIPISTSIVFHYGKNMIEICTDGGRLVRPILYRDDSVISKTPEAKMKKVSKKMGEFVFENSLEWKELSNIISSYDSQNNKNKSTLWSRLVGGFHDKKIDNFDPFHTTMYEWNDLYDGSEESLSNKNKAILEYVDANETEASLIAADERQLIESAKPYTHMELHGSTILSYMSNMIIYPQHNPLARNCFSCGQSKQAVSMYHSNHQLRMDKTAVVLNYGQVPLVKTEYMQLINQEEMPYGENAMVAIMCYTGYNVEDAILINEAALQRGLFRTTYYTTYETHEEIEVKHGETVNEKTLTDVLHNDAVIGTSPGYDYSKLDEHGIIHENTPIDEKTVLIGMSGYVPGKEFRKDMSKKPKKGQLGFVDKAFITDDAEGKRVAKVRIREERIPSFGDKFSSRAGQKGTIGMVVPEENMPFTKYGVRPDIIINPHALPSRMTIGQLIECVVGKACSIHGTFGECTAFRSGGSTNLAVFGELLSHYGFHSSGNELMYNGMNGNQLFTEVFFGPTYYMRLKHMVKDKINYRARGPNTNLTRQPVAGRANDGGLRIGEMERDAVVSHGMTTFLQESMTTRADDYEMAVCNHSGMIAVYNPSKDILLSPTVDGPLQYTKSIDTGNTMVRQFSRHGRSFSIVRVPYSLKLLMQELLAINVRMSIITEDNISQIDSMKCSKNIDLLLQVPDATPKMVIDQIREALANVEKIQEGIYDTFTPTPSSIPTPIPGLENEEEKTEHVYDSPAAAEVLPLPEYYIETPETNDDSNSTPFDVNADFTKGTSSSNQSTPFDVNADFTKGISSSNQSTPFMLGGAVHLRGDAMNKKWTILEKQPGMYNTKYVIKGDTEDEIQLVGENDIYSPDANLIYTTPYENEMEGDVPYTDDTYGMMETIPMIQPPMKTPMPNGGINFSPVIRIVQGNDHSVNTKPDMEEGQGLEMSSVNPVEIPNENQYMASPGPSAPVSVPEFDFQNIVVKKAE